VAQNEGEIHTNFTSHPAFVASDVENYRAMEKGLGEYSEPGVVYRWAFRVVTGFL